MDEGTKFCRYCGEKIPIDSEFCEKCGAKLTTAAVREGSLAEPAISHTQKLTPKAMRTKIVVVVIILLVLVPSVFVVGKYPRLQIDQAADAIRLFAGGVLFSASGTVKIDITGGGTYTITSISVSEDNPPLDYAALQNRSSVNSVSGSASENLPVSIQLPAQLLIYVQGENVTVIPSNSSMTISIVGTWSYGLINMAVNLTTSTNVRWTSYSIEALPNLYEFGNKLTG